MSAGAYNPGDLFLGRYRIERVLGAGNMGLVIAAVHIGLAQRVAIKFMLPGKATEEQHHRFLREARACARLKTSHATKVLDVGATPEGAPYMVMEYLDGRDLAAELAARGPLPFDEAVGLVLQACEAIAEAHAAGIIHRDIKPANMFVMRDQEGVPTVKVLDFGISKMHDPELALTSDVQTLGSPFYMSPEQLNASKDVDGRADIWSVGASLYELVAGKTPFHSTKIEELCTRVYMKPPTPLSAYRPDAPPGFEAVLFQCFEKDRERRYPNIGAFAAAIAPFGPVSAAVHVQKAASYFGHRLEPSRPTDVLPPEPAPLPRPPPEASTGGPVVRPAVSLSTPRRRGGIAPAVAGVAVLSLSVVVLLGLRGRSASTEVSPSSSGPPSATTTAPPAQDRPAAPEPSASIIAVPSSASAPAPSATVARPTVPRSTAAKPIVKSPDTSAQPTKPHKDPYAR